MSLLEPPLCSTLWGSYSLMRTSRRAERRDQYVLDTCKLRLEESRP